MPDLETFDLKYRPVQIADVIGQEAICASLTQQARANRLHKAYLLAGHLGSGKTTVARIIATLLNCQDRKGDVVCGKCRACLLIHAGGCPDVMEVDAASNGGVDEARSIKERAYSAPQEFEHKVYIIDEAHMLTTAAWNALLKVVEEPPPFSTFIFATTEQHKVIPTIRSRCRSYLFQGVPGDLIANRLKQVAEKEKVDLDEAAALGLGNLADGSLRDGLKFLEEASVVGKNKVTEQLLRDLFGLPERSVILSMVTSIVSGNAAPLLLAADDLIRHGADVRAVMYGISETFRNILVLETGADALANVSKGEREVLYGLSKKLSRNCLINLAKLLGRIDKEIQLNINPRLVLEAALLHCVNYVTQDVAKKQQKA